MALRALHSAATGMKAFEFQLDTIANNMANAGTTGFKKSRANFEDLFYEYFKLPGAQDTNGQFTPVGIHLGLGTRVAGVEVDHREGSLLQSSGVLDMAIVGDGFFQLQDPNGQIVYTRAGTFSVNADGAIVMA